MVSGGAYRMSPTNVVALFISWVAGIPHVQGGLVLLELTLQPLVVVLCRGRKVEHHILLRVVNGHETEETSASMLDHPSPLQRDHASESSLAGESEGMNVVRIA